MLTRAVRHTLGHSVRYTSRFWTVVRVEDGRTLARTSEAWTSPSFDHLDARGHRRGGWDIVGGDVDASPTTARDIDRRVNPRSIVDRETRVRDRRVVARTRVSRLEARTIASRDHGGWFSCWRSREGGARTTNGGRVRRGSERERDAGERGGRESRCARWMDHRGMRAREGRRAGRGCRRASTRVLLAEDGGSRDERRALGCGRSCSPRSRGCRRWRTRGRDWQSGRPRFSRRRRRAGGADRRARRRSSSREGTSVRVRIGGGSGRRCSYTLDRTTDL